MGSTKCAALVNSVASAELPRLNKFFKDDEGHARIRSAAKTKTEYRMNSELALKNGIV